MSIHGSSSIDPDDLIDRGPLGEQEYLDLGTNHQVEFSRGSIELPSPPTTTHQIMFMSLRDLLSAFAKPERLGEALFLGIRVQLWQGKYRQPDIVFMRSDNESRVGERDWFGDDLVMEIVSDSDDNRARDLITKRLEHAQAGIPEYWIVDREEGRITLLSLAGSTYAVRGESTRGDHTTSRLLPGFSGDVTRVLETKR